MSKHHKTRRYLQEWEREAIAQAYLAGEKLIALAAEFDIDPSTVSWLACRRGYRRRSGPTTGAQAKTKKLQSISKKKLAERRRRNVALRAARLAFKEGSHHGL